ncbi:MAG: putative sulfate exporter family transporter [Planctomycetia bacterium]|nr:putative sulfate exporter family transporter [Planctomycetia bacterium]
MSAMPQEQNQHHKHDQSDTVTPACSTWRQSDDLWAMLMAAVLLAVALMAIQPVRQTAPPPATSSSQAPEGLTYENWLKPWVAKPKSWDTNPLQAFAGNTQEGGPTTALAMASTAAGCVVVFVIALAGMGVPVRKSLPGVMLVAALAVLAWLTSTQTTIKSLQLKSGLRGELYIKTGLVLMGAGLLFGTLMKLGPPGILVSWITTPIVLITTYQFGQRVLGIKSKTLNLVLSADMSVCGVSAAVATAAACRAKKEELSIAVGISLAFTVVMMFALPAACNALGLDEVLAGAWIGGTVDSTGAVVAAGELVGPVARDVAASVKLIQNVMIGFISLAVAAWWARSGDGDAATVPTGFGGLLAEIWQRLPKFILGFVAASAIFTLVASVGSASWQDAVKATLSGPVKMMRSWCFCLAFVSIGLETDIRKLATVMGSAKPVVLYLCGQAFNLLLTFTMAYLAFRVVFPDVAARLAGGG